MGSIFRTADAAGIEKIYLCGITPAPVDTFGKLRPQLAKVSLGAEKTVGWERTKSTTKVLDELKKNGYKILAVEQGRRATPYHKLKVKNLKLKTVALVLGNEVKGLPASVLNRADKILEIPMAGRKESLNVAVAFGIVAYGIKYRGQK